MPKRVLIPYLFLCLILWICLARTICWAQQVDDPGVAFETGAEYLDTVNGLSVEDVVKLALERNADLLAFKQRAVERQGLLKQAGLKPNPEFSTSITGGSILNSPGEREYSIAYTHIFELGGKRSRRIELASLEADIAGYEIADRERQLVADTKTAYVEALAAIRNVNALQQTLDLIEKTNEVTAQRVKEGEAPALEQGLSTVELNRAKADLALATSEAEAQIYSLKTLLASDPQENLLLKGEWRFEETDVDIQGVLEKALLNRPDLLAARLQEKAAEAQIDLTKAEAVSDLNGFAGYAHTASQFDQLGLNEAGSRVPLTDQDNTISVGISFNLPLRNRNQGNIHAAIARREAARLKTKGLELRIDQEVRSAVSGYKAAGEAVRILKTIVVPQSEKNLEVVRTSYELGELRFLDLIQEQRRALEMQNAYTGALKAYLLSLVQLENTTVLRMVGKEW
jgi:cobalt-zinc-cadmium efflux system outer membrane protein